MNQNKRDLATCKERLEQAAYLYKAGKEAEANEILQEISVLGSKITIRQREILMDSGVPTAREDVEKIIAETHPMDIGFTPEGWFGIRMEPLAKTKDTASKEYIRGIIYPAMRRFFADKATVRYPDCTLIFRHVYDRNIPDAQYRDYDNVEVKIDFDKVILEDNEEDGKLTGEVKFILYKGNHYHLTVFTDWDEDIFVDTNDVWDDGDRVGITIAPEHIRLNKL